MNRKALIVILAVLLAVAGIVVWRGGLNRASAAGIQPDASLALLPPQATTVFGLNVDALRASPLYATWRQHADQIKRDKDYTEFVARTGFDLERDLGGVTAAVWRKPNTTDRYEPEFLAVVTARYQRSSLSAFLREKALRQRTIAGSNSWELRNHRTARSAAPPTASPRWPWWTTIPFWPEPAAR